MNFKDLQDSKLQDSILEKFNTLKDTESVRDFTLLAIFKAIRKNQIIPENEKETLFNAVVENFSLTIQTNA